ncbi:MAG: hypothetical protein ACJASC_003454 [Limimaricola cinnabarinus]|jgi:hypothetical protein
MKSIAAKLLCLILATLPVSGPTHAAAWYRIDLEQARITSEALTEGSRSFARREEGGALSPLIVPDRRGLGHALSIFSRATPEGARADRSEITIYSGIAPGRRWFLGLEALLPSEVPTPQDWQILAQCVQPGSGKSPPISLDLEPDGSVSLVARSDADGFETLWNGPMPRDRWTGFVLEFEFGEPGFARLWVDGQEVVARQLPLIWREGEPRCVLKTGLYRAPSTGYFEMLIDNVILGNDRASVTPQR